MSARVNKLKKNDWDDCKYVPIGTRLREIKAEKGECDLCDKPKIAQIHNTVTTQLQTDYIKRKDAINVFDWGEDLYVSCGVATQNIKDIPAADVRENVKGKWIIEDNIVPINFIDGYVETKRCICSKCGYKPTYMGRTILPTTKTLLFCPNCGADMRGKV